MKRIAVFYHCRLIGDGLDADYSITMMAEQMATLKASGLEQAANDLVMLVNGDSENQLTARMLAPGKARFIDNGAGAQGLLRSVNRLREWCRTHPDWLVCFWHNKGVTHPWDLLNTRWRQCMEKAVIKNWRRCVMDLESGLDSVGAHWLTPEQFRGIVRLPFWGGQFFWANSSFLATLPQLPNNPVTRDDWFLSENWIGMGRRPRVKDYCPHWPGISECGKNALV